MLQLQHLPGGAPLTAVGSVRSRDAATASRIASLLPLPLRPVALVEAQAAVAAAGPGSLRAPSLPPAARLRG